MGLGAVRASAKLRTLLRRARRASAKLVFFMGIYLGRARLIPRGCAMGLFFLFFWPDLTRGVHSVHHGSLEARRGLPVGSPEAQEKGRRDPDLLKKWTIFLTFFSPYLFFFRRLIFLKCRFPNLKTQFCIFGVQFLAHFLTLFLVSFYPSLFFLSPCFFSILMR